MLKLLFCKFADVFDRDRQYLFSATVKMERRGEIILYFPVDVPIEDMEVEGYVTFYDDVEGLVTYWCNYYNVTRLEPEDRISMNVTTLELEEQVQRRQDLKNSVRFKIEVDYTDLLGKKRFCQAEVENISAGGVFFTSEHKFNLGDSVILRLSEISTRLFASADVMRIQSLDDWESSEWLVKEEKAAAPVRPAAPEGQNIFSFVRKRKSAAPAPAVAAAPVEPAAPRMAFQKDLDEDYNEGMRMVEEDIGGDTRRYGYGCRFSKIGESKENVIRRFVFEQERLRLQSTR